eukprot:TRINITY_DN5759_c0_g4_i2.p1 TRINITY_DN5759_c0_g4~~TRINITY_DN5759_c0_g4_i2.p1  ORF type:complete len:925 (+),score=257.56 TRINITY_DN5759_c0_g4_i2:78-2777(+)
MAHAYREGAFRGRCRYCGMPPGGNHAVPSPASAGSPPAASPAAQPASPPAAADRGSSAGTHSGGAPSPAAPPQQPQVYRSAQWGGGGRPAPDPAALLSSLLAASKSIVHAASLRSFAAAQRLPSDLSSAGSGAAGRRPPSESASNGSCSSGLPVLSSADAPAAGDSETLSLRSLAALLRLPSERTVAAGVELPDSARSSTRTRAARVATPDILAATGVLQRLGRSKLARDEATRRRAARARPWRGLAPAPRAAHPPAPEVLALQCFGRCTASRALSERQLRWKASLGLLMKLQRERQPQPPLRVPRRSLEEQERAFVSLQAHARRKQALQAVERVRVARARSVLVGRHPPPPPLHALPLEAVEDPAAAAVQRAWRCGAARSERAARAAARARGAAAPVRRSRPAPPPKLWPAAPLEEQEARWVLEAERQRRLGAQLQTLDAAPAAATVVLCFTMTVTLPLAALRALLFAAVRAGREVAAPLDAEAPLLVRAPAGRPSSAAAGLRALRVAACSTVAPARGGGPLSPLRAPPSGHAPHPSDSGAEWPRAAQRLPRPSSAPLHGRRRSALPQWVQWRRGPAEPDDLPGSPCRYRWAASAVQKAVAEAPHRTGRIPGAADATAAERLLLARVESQHREHEEGALRRETVRRVWESESWSRERVAQSELSEVSALGRMHWLWLREIRDAEEWQRASAAASPQPEPPPPSPVAPPRSRPGISPLRRPRSALLRAGAGRSPAPTQRSRPHSAYSTSTYAAARSPVRTARLGGAELPADSGHPAESEGRRGIARREEELRDRALLRLSVALSKVRRSQRGPPLRSLLCAAPRPPLRPGAAPGGEPPLLAATQAAGEKEAAARDGVADRERRVRERLAKGAALRYNTLRRQCGKVLPPPRLLIPLKSP